MRNLEKLKEKKKNKKKFKSLRDRLLERSA